MVELAGGELPFGFELVPEGGGLGAVFHNGEERLAASEVAISGDEVLIRFDWYDSDLQARLVGPGRLAGEFRRTGSGGADGRLRFAAERGRTERFVALAAVGGAAGPEASVDGRWRVEFTNDDGTVDPAIGELRQQGSRVLGTFMLVTGDYRFLEGSFEQGRLRLSVFDGAHAFLFDARLDASDRLTGDVWARDGSHASWWGERLAASAPLPLPDPWAGVGLRHPDGRFGFRFPDALGTPVSLADPRFAGRVVVVEVLGTWCPNCNDSAPVLERLYRAHRAQGLEVVGLAYEMTADRARSARQVQRFTDRLGLTFPILLAGTSDKQAAGATLPDLTAVLAFPTTLFIGRDGAVRRIHSGFVGPGAGSHHEALVAEWQRLVDELLAEPARGARG